jgi:hypothetical protein
MSDRISLDSDADSNAEGYDGDWSQAEIDWQANIDYHRKHCGRCWNDEECKVLERLWNTKV